MRRRVALLSLAALAGTAVVSLPLASSRAAPRSPEPGPVASAEQRVWREVFSPDGRILRVQVPLPRVPSVPPRRVAAEVVPVQRTGPSANRLDIVFVGDGYTRLELDTYADDVRSRWQELSRVEPFRTYRNYFNVWRVDVVSLQSGVDNDPVFGIQRVTALDMRFWCADIERLLCVDEEKAQAYAANAPQADQVLALANSTKYGGAGSGSAGGVATSAGGNASSGQIVVHELGHSIGRLTDEYVLTPGRYTGAEPEQANTSTYPAGVMRDQRTKWYRWLGATSPDGGRVGTYEGAGPGDTGVYRPTKNSIMRTLGREFNLPGREAMIEAFYRYVTPIDAVAPATDQDLTGAETVSVTPTQPVGYALSVRWYLDGRELTRYAGRHAVRLPALGLRGRHTVTVRVTDPTTYVRDEAFRARYMTAERTWTVSAG